jgi:hypothetical protein
MSQESLEEKLNKPESPKEIIWPELPATISRSQAIEILGIEDKLFQQLIDNRYLSINPMKKALGRGVWMNHDMLRKLAYVVMKKDDSEYKKNKQTSYALLGDEIRHNWFVEIGDGKPVEEFVQARLDSLKESASINIVTPNEEI